MRSSLNKHRQTSLFGYAMCDADEFSPLISQGDKGLVRTRCPGNYRNMVDCHCEDIQLFIDEVRGLDFSNKIVAGSSPFISARVPVIPKECFDDDPETIDGDIVGVRLGDILSHKPRRNNAGVLLLSDDVRIDLSVLKRPVFQGKKVVLFATGIDVVIEKIWHRRFAMNLFQAIAAGDFYAVTGMNFSLFLHECPLGHLINLNKSLVFCEELGRLGVPVIPHVYAITDTHREMWVSWLKNHPDIKTVLINTQMQRDFGSMHEVELTVQSLLENTQVNVILNGRQPKKPLYGKSHRVIASNQFGLKKQALIKNSLVRQTAILEQLIGRNDVESSPRLHALARH